MMRILVTGSRDWPDAQPIWDALTEELARLRLNSTSSIIPTPSWEIVLVHGAAKGADAIAESWACHQQNEGWPVCVEGHPARWQAEGRGAGILRNLRMVRSTPKPDLCLAFIRNNSRGATHCAIAAQQHGISTRIIHLTASD